VVYKKIRKSYKTNQMTESLSKYALHGTVKFGYHTCLYGEGEIVVGKTPVLDIIV